MVVRVSGAEDLEVVFLEMNGDLRAFAEDAVHDRLAEVEVEGVAELVGFGLVGALAALALIALGVLTVGGLLELIVDLAHGLLLDLADAARGELPLVALFADVASLLKDFEEVLELLEGVGGFFAEQLAELVLVDVVEVAAVLGLFELLFELVDVLEVAHEVHRLEEVELFVATKGVLALAVARGDDIEVDGELV